MLKTERECVSERVITNERVVPLCRTCLGVALYTL